MVTAVLKAWIRTAGLLALVGTAGCSLVLDTDECTTDADCNFGDGPTLQCVSAECVPGTRQMALVESTIVRDTVWGAQQTWVVQGVVVVERGITLTLDANTRVEIRPDAALVIEHGARLESTATSHAPAVIRSMSGPDALFMVEAQPPPPHVLFE